MSVLGVRADIVFPAKKLAIFVDGCFWHRCPAHYVPPKTRAEFWEKKIRSNVDRDRRQTETLHSHGWTVMRFWEHEVLSDLDAVVSAITDS